MTAFRTKVGKVLPQRVKEILNILFRYQEDIKRERQITIKNQHKIDFLLKSYQPIRLEFGGGFNRGIIGWTYVDISMECDLTLDLTKPLPFPDNSVSSIYSSHLLEHFKYSELRVFLNECLRVLQPDGLFSAAVPNAKIYLDAYLNSENFDPDSFCLYRPAYQFHSKVDYVNYIAYMDGHHKYMFDEENLISILKSTGFGKVAMREFEEHLDLKERDYESIYVAARKE